MERYSKDMVACMGALQLAPKFMTSWGSSFGSLHSIHAEMNRFVYAVITNRGRALDVLFTRLKLAMDPKQRGQNEEESIKKVSMVRLLRWKTVHQ